MPEDLDRWLKHGPSHAASLGTARQQPPSSPLVDLTGDSSPEPEHTAMPKSSPAKPASARKGKKSATADDDVDEKPRASTSTSNSKRTAIQIISDSDDDDVDVDAKKAVVSRSPPKKKVATGPSAGKKRKVDDESDDEDKKPKPKGKGKGRRDDDDDDGFVVPDDADEDDDNAKPKKAKASTSNGTSTKKPAPPKKDTAGEKPKSKWEPGKSVGQARDPGSKEIPVGQPNCLAGLTFVFTGELESLDRDGSMELAKRYGARVTGAPSSKTSFVVVGANAGDSKLKKIAAHNLKTLDENAFLDLIRTRSGNDADPAFKKKQVEEAEKIKEIAKQMGPAKGSEDDKNQLWTVKYAPKSIKEICGNKGMVAKLQRWLHDFDKSRQSNFKKGGPDGLGLHRCILISGPPGIGKTTAAHLVARLEGYLTLELNASDTRGKKLLEAALRSTIDNRPIDGFFGGVTDTEATTSKAQAAIASGNKRLVLIMDEVDGMSAGDRGGVGALNQLIKKTKTPIICICNDAKSQKMRPLMNTTYHMQFRRPDAAAIKSRMMSIAFKEGLKTDGNVVDQLVAGAQSDIRQIVNMLATWRLGQASMSFDEGKKYAEMQAKNTIQTPFTLINTLFSPYAFKSTSPRNLDSKLELYFGDFGAVPLFVQENYLKHKFSRSATLSGRDFDLKRLELVYKAADAISDGDLVDRMVHGDQQQWSLLPVHGMFSSVRPAYWCHGQGGFGTGGGGGFGGNPATNTQAFPAWFGKNSTQGKLHRMLGDIQIRMRLHVSGDRREIRQSYLPTLTPRLTGPLVKDGEDAIDDVIAIMDSYFLTKEEFDGIIELAITSEDLLKGVSAATKSAFTRTYNKGDHPIPFHAGQSLGGKMRATKIEADLEDVIEQEESGPDDDDDAADDDVQTSLAKDRLIKAKKPRAAAASKAKGEKAVKATKAKK